MTENEIREPYEQPELIKLGSIREITFETPGWTFSGACDPFIEECP